MNEVNFQEEIVKVARNLFEKSGRVEGRDLDNWLEAERIVITRHKQAELEAKIPTKKMALTKRSLQKKLK